ncbi:envelope glycoprotein [Anopheles sinensis]|uniref:Envelope glycoprotein n=1 Tax=Anopheles sinensis TaxID=74873 RepID=A0A084VA12_ANOSI|nr:envelope glycoprotein [Anopheles sinensis]
MVGVEVEGGGGENQDRDRTVRMFPSRSLIPLTSASVAKLWLPCIHRSVAGSEPEIAGRKAVGMGWGMDVCRECMLCFRDRLEASICSTIYPKQSIDPAIGGHKAGVEEGKGGMDAHERGFTIQHPSGEEKRNRNLST